MNRPAKQKSGWTRAIALILLCIFMALLVAGRMRQGCGRGHHTRFSSSASSVSAPLQNGKVLAASSATVDRGQDVAALRAREDLLLEHAGWANAEHTKVRIPIERAMELLAERGLPVQQNAPASASMRGDGSLRVTEPLTTGDAPTAYEGQARN